MTAGWLIVVLAAASLHATWNLLLKSGRDRIAFTLMMLIASVLLYLPAFAMILRTKPVPAASWKWIFASGAIHTAYFYLLSLAYAHIDLSLVYPVARGAGAALAVAGGTILLGERPNAPGWCGILALTLGISILLSQAGSRRRESSVPGDRMSSISICAALGAGITIGGYSVVDKVGVGISHPFIHLYLTKVLCASLFTLAVTIAQCAGRKAVGEGLAALAKRVRREWRANGAHAVAAGLFTPLTYVLVLFAMTACKVSYVAPLRETSVLFSMLLAKRILKERTTGKRWGGTLLVLVGVVLLGTAR